MNLIEYKILPRQRMWIQGTGYPFISPFQEKQKEKKKEVKIEQKPQKSLQELTIILDTHGESELSKDEKKQELSKIVEQNYQK